MLNNAVSHPCKVRIGICTLSKQTAWIHESAKAFSLVVDEANPIHPELVLNRDELIFVHPNKVQTDEYSHLTLEQCNIVHEDLVNQYKSLAEKINERIHWSELDSTSNQLSAERHKLNFRLQEVEDEKAKHDREERARMAKPEKEFKDEKAKHDREERARMAKHDKEERVRMKNHNEEEREERKRQKREGGKQIKVFVNAKAIDRKLMHIQLTMNSHNSIL